MTMHFQFEVTPQGAQPVRSPGDPVSTAEVADLLRTATSQLQSLVEVQKELLSVQKTAIDSGSRWRAFLARWQDDYPDMPKACQTILPTLEKTYLGLISELTELVQSQGSDALDNEFALADFLDRYGMRLGQLGTILSLVTPLAECAAPQAPPQQQE